MARAMWKATLRLSQLELPVKLYAAIEDRGVHFRLLHAEDHVPVVQRMVDPARGEEVRKEQVRRGVELEPGVFVLLSEEELAAGAPKASRAIEVLRCLPRSAIDPAWWSRPYLLGPDGREHEYYALARALEESGRLGVARWVMRGKRYQGALAPREGRLALVTLQPPEAVVAAEQLAKPQGPPLREGERALAEQLVAALDAPFDPAALRDEHRERVLELVAAKAEGRRPRLEPVEPKRPTADLTRALRESLRAARERRVA